MAKFKESEFYLGWRKLKADLEPMTFKQKVEHIWMYYKEHMLVGLILVLLLIAMCTSFITANQKTLASGVMINLYMEQEGYDYLSVDYFERLGGKKNREKVALEYIYIGDVDDPTNSSDGMSKIESVAARVSGQMLDYMFLDKGGMETFIMYEVYMDLREFFTPQELEALEAEGRIVYAKQEDDEEAWPVAVDITPTDFVQDNVNSEGNVYFAVSGSTQRIEICRDMWQYIHEWKTQE